METNHEEADNIIVIQVSMCARQNVCSGITVICDDTDVFVLLLHYYHKMKLQNLILMESPIKGRAVIDIPKTVEKHVGIVENILPAHALSGCDTVACCYGIGKGTIVKTLRSGHTLSHLGLLESPLESVISQATIFMSACYGQSINCQTMSETRI